MKRLVFILCIFLIGVSVTALSYDKPLRNKVLDFGACENDLDSHLDVRVQIKQWLHRL